MALSSARERAYKALELAGKGDARAWGMLVELAGEVLELEARPASSPRGRTA